jgi:SAM-dependent methyltransferase
MLGWRNAAFALLSGAARALDLAARASLYLAAGTLRRDGLKVAITRTWDEFSRSEGEILSGLMAWEKTWYERALKPTDRILLVGCGTGRDLIALLELGYRVDGLDVSERAIELARRMLEARRLSATLYTGAIEDVVPDGSVDAVVFSWFCYGYIPQKATRIAALRGVARRLAPGGRVLISYVPAEASARSLPIRLTRLVARLTRSDWEPEPGDVLGPPTADRRAVGYEHQFAERELEDEVAAAGLTVVSHERSDVGTAVLMREPHLG